ncbi:MAG: carbohydrate-binding family 9-like protein [Fusicatenibacter sp.]|nr:carbohydrate-binding family 9-like protein [Fusicatenibacter sp.]
MNHINIPIPAVGFCPPVYVCHRARLPFVPDGNLDKPFWENAPFTDEFLDIEGSHMPLPRFVTRAKMLWDDENLYVGAILDGDEIWGHVNRRDDVIFQDNDFEIFIDPDSDTWQYYEFEMNVLNTVWDLFLPVPYRDGGSGLHGYDIHGLETAVSVDGAINSPESENKKWSVEVKIPFAALTECLKERRTPKDGEYYRMNFSRVQWKVDISDRAYQKRTDETGKVLPEDNWVWAPTGVINIHYPELWAFVFFSCDGRPDVSYTIPEDEYRKWELRKLYYAEKILYDTKGHYTSDLKELTDLLGQYAPNEKNASVRDLPYRIETTTHSFELSCPSSEEGYELVVYSTSKAEKVPRR